MFQECCQGRRCTDSAQSTLLSKRCSIPQAEKQVSRPSESKQAAEMLPRRWETTLSADQGHYWMKRLHRRLKKSCLQDCSVAGFNSSLLMTHFEVLNLKQETVIKGDQQQISSVSSEQVSSRVFAHLMTRRKILFILGTFDFV